MNEKVRLLLGWLIAGGLFATVLGWFFVLTAGNARGNLFAGATATQLLVWGRLAGILAACGLLFLLLTMGKGRLLGWFFPQRILTRLHRWGGFVVGGLALAHFLLIFIGRSIAFEEPFGKVVWDFLGNGNWGSVTFFGVLLMVLVLFFSALFLRKKMSSGAWKITHYFAYLVVLSLFFHQIFCGTEFAVSAGFRWFWTALFCLVVLEVALWKGRMFFSGKQ